MGQRWAWQVTVPWSRNAQIPRYRATTFSSGSKQRRTLGATNHLATKQVSQPSVPTLLSGARRAPTSHAEMYATSATRVHKYSRCAPFSHIALMSPTCLRSVFLDLVQLQSPSLNRTRRFTSTPIHTAWARQRIHRSWTRLCFSPNSPKTARRVTPPSSQRMHLRWRPTTMSRIPFNPSYRQPTLISFVKEGQLAVFQLSWYHSPVLIRWFKTDRHCRAHQNESGFHRGRNCVDHIFIFTDRSEQGG